ncbi:MAG: hypothetical protein HOM11_03735 [Methylococcales bacterium]|jgi:predicted metal-dependent HD superfamily phosphohydrolase|nr:hypothetical protein [Methylococcales bacterium]MBT7442450.1 hypothetical protein [Methylococcales bacterium]
MVALSSERWQQLMLAWSLPESVKTLTVLQQHYAEAHRAYHTAEHILACLHHFDAVQDHLQMPEVVEMAIWFHDVIYNPTQSDNEALSAAMAAQFLVSSSHDWRESVIQMILATQSHQAPVDSDMAFMLDIDLSILGADAEVFQPYEADIRFEYQFVPKALYQQKRCEILEQFLARPRLYFTDYFQQKLGVRAEENLAWAVAFNSAV